MFFKILRGYNAEDYIGIDRSELEKAYYCFLEKKDSIFTGGAIKGSQILAIQPDYHMTMGWNRGYKLEALDYEELSQKGIDRKLQNLLAEARDKVQYLIETKQEHLIGKNIDMPKIETKFSEEIRKLGDSKRIT